MRHHLVQSGTVSEQIADDLANLTQAKLLQSQFTIPGGPRRQRPIGPEGQHHQDLSAFRCGHPGFQKVLTGFVQPVQIFNNDHRGLRPCRLHDPADAIAQPHASRRRVDSPRCRLRRRASQKIRQGRKMLGDRQREHRKVCSIRVRASFGVHIGLDAEEGAQCFQHRH